MNKSTAADLLAGLSAVAIIYGVAQVAPALAWIVAGLFGAAASYILATAD